MRRNKSGRSLGAELLKRFLNASCLLRSQAAATRRNVER